MPKRYAYQNNHVVHDDFGDEVVTINLKKGVYYSLANSGRIIWLLLKNEPTLETIMQAITQIYDVNLTDTQQAIQEFLDELIKEELVHAYVHSGPGQEATLDNIIEQVQLPEKPPFYPPVINTYEDQKELLLLDPIHEVAELGWPEKKKD